MVWVDWSVWERESMVLCFLVERKSKEEEDMWYIWMEEKKGEKFGVFYDKLENVY